MNKSTENFKIENFTIAAMEPMLINHDNKRRDEIYDLAHQLTIASTQFSASIPNGMENAIANIVRTMNCYYSNLIEGHDTHPIDIEKATNNDYSNDTKKRNLQLEAKAHIITQKWIDDGGLNAVQALTQNGIKAIHKIFFDNLPEELKIINYAKLNRKVNIIGGEYRNDYVEVAQHIPISHIKINEFMERFENVYSNQTSLDKIVNSAAAHHRLSWIHPFFDGNGRVTRLMSHAVLSKTLDNKALWSISRGLARKVSDYKIALSNCDKEKRNSYDGRGHLSEEALNNFTIYFLKICLDQVRFMEQLIEPKKINARLILWLKEEIAIGNIDERVINFAERLLFFGGQIPKSEVAPTFNLAEKQSLRLIKPLRDIGLIKSQGLREPWQIDFPIKLCNRLLPGLFPEM